MKRIAKLFMIVIGIGVVVYVGLAVYANIAAFQTDTPAAVKVPPVSEATYEVVVQNTGTLYLSPDVKTYGIKAGARVFILKGYYEMIGRDFKYRDRDLPLDESIYGAITVTKRKTELK